MPFSLFLFFLSFFSNSIQQAEMCAAMDALEKCKRVSWKLLWIIVFHSIDGLGKSVGGVREMEKLWAHGHGHQFPPPPA